MHKIILAAVVLTPLFGGLAFAQRPDRSYNYDFAAGPMAYPDWQQQWARLPGYPVAAAPAPTHHERHLANEAPPSALPSRG